MSILLYLLTVEYEEEPERDCEEKKALLEAEERARDPWLFCDEICCECEKETFDSCEYALKMTYNRYSNPI
ncbi:MAG: hypothetical protein IKD89_03145 [Clostridia bacterium]|nr:hypothetical protein [Clostridia bacterium]